MSYMVDLEAFHGPLDLLLYLIEKNEVDIYDIPIAKIAEQYLQYINVVESIDLEQLGDFLFVASYLLNLKSKLLLPKHDTEFKDAEDEIDPRDELVQRLLEYKKYKKAAEYLAMLKQEELVFYRTSDFKPEVNEILVAKMETLVKAYKEVLERVTESELASSLEIPASDVSVADKMQELVEVLYNNPLGLIFQDLFRGLSSKREVLALFLALLELIRLQKVMATQPDRKEIIISLLGE